ncbi:Zinc finger BED domain-containing protein 5 [Eumeta japonica]|uniref:Zinc finger BED domain-containing protein 5 n=1 Tax=Eumeta variegata TaxID=151549 RepID=A0A4C1TJL4_EUMVA|nr:Zinc finger BED domain-containing protein 5 [Eumeta japonica]
MQVHYKLALTKNLSTCLGFRKNLEKIKTPLIERLDSARRSYTCERAVPLIKTASELDAVVVNKRLSEIYESLLEMSSDTSMESLFKTTPLNDFWCRIRDEYPMLGKMAPNILLPFSTAYLC